MNMSGIVSKVSKNVCKSCRSSQIKRDGCSVSLNSAPSTWLIINMDCQKIKNLQTGKNCDYIFIGEDSGTTWIAPIELKGGSFKASAVAKQLQDGMNLAANWIPGGRTFEFVPTLFYPAKKRVHPYQIARLRELKIKFQQYKSNIKIQKCKDPISSVLNSSK